MTSRLVILHDIKYKILDRYLKMNYKKDMFTSNVGYIPKKEAAKTKTHSTMIDYSRSLNM